MHGSTPNIIYVGIMSAGVPPPPVGSIGPWRAGEGELKTQKIGGVVSFVHRTATISIFLSDDNVVQYVGHRPVHILV